MSRLRGNWATLLLPIADDDSIDFDRLDVEIDALINARVDGVYSNGTAGEFHNQTEAEYDRIQELLADRCTAAGVPFVIGACHPDPLVSCNRIRRAARLTPDAIQVILPDWVPVTDSEAVDFLSMAADAASGAPLVLYNPPHAKRVFAPADLGAVLRRAGSAVRGVKLADGDAAWYSAARQHLTDWAVFVPGHDLATGVREGVAAGAFSNIACLSPRGAQLWTDWMSSNLPAALELERRIRVFLDTYILPYRTDSGYSNAALDKLLAAIGNWAPVGTRLRRPYRWIAEAEADHLRSVARASIPEIFQG
ncbi:N-acetylneuraminate lyase [Microvirga vignae]|uniref:N-acetylneuraminate lyase n=1 Tax=Microvirga vignae TaxID=1225564 RepID=A0A0H1R8C1_9HYPH|nr:dihydrodipicolinate synthase family protein [Microvirga vignae]KLK91289.1 N-acetylneuraminate lyase [Microvirga vignae]